VGYNGSVQGIAAALTIHNQPAYDTLVIDDSADGASHTSPAVVLSAGGITGLAPYPITFTSFSVNTLTVLGGTGSNIFIVAGTPATASTTLNTGPGTNTVNLQATGVPTTLSGNPAGTNTLVGPNATTTWNITGADAGSVAGGSAAAGFSGYGNLTGGSGANIFSIFDGGSLSGTITGGGGPATLDYSAGWSDTVIVDLQTGQATAVAGGVSGILNVNGANGGGLGLYNLLIGVGGNTLTGGVGRQNLLVAGGSFSTLIGGDSYDLLIGGTTTYDTESGLGSWHAIATYWVTASDPTTWVYDLTTPNGVPLLDATTVTGNGGNNTMTGNGELALIYTDTADFITGFASAYYTVGISP
jgi:hypothetical protein